MQAIFAAPLSKITGEQVSTARKGSPRKNFHRREESGRGAISARGGRLAQASERANEQADDRPGRSLVRGLNSHGGLRARSETRMRFAPKLTVICLRNCMRGSLFTNRTATKRALSISPARKLRRRVRITLVFPRKKFRARFRGRCAVAMSEVVVKTCPRFPKRAFRAEATTCAARGGIRRVARRVCNPRLALIQLIER